MRRGTLDRPSPSRRRSPRPAALGRRRRRQSVEARAATSARGGRPPPCGAGSARRRSSGRGTRRTARRGSTSDVSRPTRSSSANGPIGKLHPPFIAASMSSMRRGAVLEHPHRVVEVREEQGVHDEAGPVLHLDRLLAAGHGEGRARRRSSRRSAVSGRTISTRLMSGAGLKKWTPHTRSGRSVWTASSTTGSVEVLVARMASGLHDLLELGEQRLLDGEVLDDRLDDQVAVDEVAEVVGGRDPAEDRHARRRVELALLDLAVQAPARARPSSGVGRGRDAGADARPRSPALAATSASAGAHDPRADDPHPLDDDALPWRDVTDR